MEALNGNEVLVIYSNIKELRDDLKTIKHVCPACTKVDHGVAKCEQILKQIEYFGDTK